MVDEDFDEPAIPPALRRPLAAIWISLGLHGAVIALVQVAPPAASESGTSVIEARLVSQHVVTASTPEVSQPTARVQSPQLFEPSKTPQALRVPPTEPRAEPAESPAAAVQPAASQQAPDPTPAPAGPHTAAPAPAATITSSVDLTYYGWRDLDVRPRPLREIKPDYPYEADRQGVPGCVVLRLKHEADGRVSDVEVISVTPHGYSFETEALRAFRNAPYLPGYKLGRPVRALQEVVVQFDSHDGRRASCDVTR